MAFTLRDLLKEVSESTNSDISITFDGQLAETILDLQIWSVTHKPTADPAAVIYDGVIYIANRKE